MDSRAYIDPITGSVKATIDGKLVGIIVDPSLEIGQRKRFILPKGEYIAVRHTEDIVWDLVNRNFLISERTKAQRFLRNKAIEVRIELGFPREIPFIFPLPFSEETYNFTGL